MLLTTLRKDLSFNGEMLSLVDTLKNIAGSQYHQMEKEKERFELFMTAFAEFFRVVDMANVDDPLVRVMSDNVGVLIVTSDSGFMGGLNQGVIRRALASVSAVPPSNVRFMLIGDKGAGVFDDQGRPYEFFSGIGQEQGDIYRRAVEVKEFIVRNVLERHLGRVEVVYPRAKSFTSQTIEVSRLLPCAELFDRAAESEVARHTGVQRVIAEVQKVAVESDPSDMLQYLASVWTTSKLFEIFEDSKLAEFSARAMHLEGSVEKLEKQHKKLRQMVFKATHEQIDKGMREGYASKSLKEKLKKASAA